jgi:hypothetical protein
VSVVRLIVAISSSVVELFCALRVYMLWCYTVLYRAAPCVYTCDIYIVLYLVSQCVSLVVTSLSTCPSALNIHYFLSLFLRPHVIPFPLFSFFPPFLIYFFPSFCIVHSLWIALIFFLSYVFHFLTFAGWYSENLRLSLNVKLEKQLKWNDYFCTNFQTVCLFVSAVPCLEQTDLWG